MSERQYRLMIIPLLALYPFLMVVAVTREVLWGVVAYGLTLVVCGVIEWRM